MTTNKCSQPWIDTTIRRGIRKKCKLFRKARKSNSVTDWVAFRNQRRKLDRQIRSKHREYMTGVIGASLETSNTKPFWNYVDSFGIPPQMTSSGNLATSQKRKANVLNQQFQSVFSSETTQELPRVDDLGIPNLPPLMITEPGVYKLLTDLKEHKPQAPMASLLGYSSIAQIAWHLCCRKYFKLPLTTSIYHRIGERLISPRYTRKATNLALQITDRYP